MDILEKRKFPRFPVTNPVLCFRYGRQITMRTQNISFGGLRLVANLDLRVGESLDFDILTNGTKVHCKGRILAIEDLKDKVQARLCFTPTSDSEYRKLNDYLDTLSPGKRIPFERGVIVGLFILSTYMAYLIIRTYFFR
ncbi:MAG: PilZ domain-containing protein [Methanomassiliicoccales archaeon]|nr:MAG: PilZ domain-containing protein [Methanomassiliicoccales archaeon]